MLVVAAHTDAAVRGGKHQKQVSISIGKKIEYAASHRIATIPSRIDNCGADGSNIAIEFGVLRCFRWLAGGDGGTKNHDQVVCQGGEGTFSQLQLYGRRSNKHAQLWFSTVLGDRNSHIADRAWMKSCELCMCIPYHVNEVVAKHHASVAAVLWIGVRGLSWSLLHHTT